MEIKLKGCHFDTIEVTEAQSQAVLNTLKDHDIQEAFKMVEVLGTVHTSGRGLLQGVTVASRPKVGF
jgi:hypothetical protein